MNNRASQFINRILNNIKKGENVILPQKHLNLQHNKNLRDYDLEVNPYLIDNTFKNLTPEIEYLNKKDFIEKQKYLLLKYQL